MRRFVAPVLVGVLLTGAVVAYATVKARPDEEKVGWIALNEVGASSRSVRIQFSHAVCSASADDDVSRIVVRRKRRTIVITVLMVKPKPGSDQVCTQMARVYKRKVSLKGRLGRRSIKDGMTGEVRVERP